MPATPASAGPSLPSRDVRHPAHARRKLGSFGMLLFLASLSMLFAASMIGYLLISFFVHAPREVRDANGQITLVEGTVPDVTIPPMLWVSTALILASSFTIAAAQSAARRERQPALRFWLGSTLALAVGFCVLQAPALVSLFTEHAANIPDEIVPGQPVYAIAGLVATLIIIHAAHVVGGIVPLIYVTARAFHGAYDHEWHEPVNHVASYWHFLDVVWIIMFTVFLVST
ncbi:MAG: cytochrome c oxidase subunit 3 [Planctomycetota bacterium]